MTEEQRDLMAARASRRTALKAAAAAGVGAAVLAGPQFGPIGTAPAYAVGCSKSASAPVNGHTVNCAAIGTCGPGVDTLRLNQQGSAGTTSVTVGGVTATLANLNNHCTNQALPLTYSNGTGAGITCILTVQVSGTAYPNPIDLPAVIPTISPCNETWNGTLTCFGTDGIVNGVCTN